MGAMKAIMMDMRNLQQGHNNRSRGQDTHHKGESSVVSLCVLGGLLTFFVVFLWHVVVFMLKLVTQVQCNAGAVTNSVVFVLHLVAQM